MGSASSKDRQQDSVDYGSLHPQGIYTGAQDWNHNIVAQLIIERKLAPFYTPLEDYSDDWDDDQVLAARKLRTRASGSDGEPAHIPPAPTPPRHSHSSKSSRAGKEPQRLTEAQIYKSAVECPICFLYYPPNINHSRCCFQAICTECFVQVKRAEPTPTHLVSEPACCPYCVQENFGITYTPPPWRAGIGGEGHLRPELSKTISSEGDVSKGRRKSFGHNSPEVVTIDQIRPDWEAKLAAVKAAVTRRANRRIIMRQVGDRLIPVGVTSGRVHTIQPDSNGTMAIAGQDLEELMMMEAMRLSLLEHEEQQRRAATTSGGSSSSATAIAASPPLATTSAVSASVPNPSSMDMASASSNPRRRSHTPIVPSALGNASNVIAIAIGLPSDPAVGSNPDSTDSDTGQNHRRSEPQPPPATTSVAALGASGTAMAFLRPSTPTRDSAVPEAPIVSPSGPVPDGSSPTGAPSTTAADDNTEDDHYSTPSLPSTELPTNDAH